MTRPRHRSGLADIEVEIVDYIDVIPTKALVAELESRARSEPDAAEATSKAPGSGAALAVHLRDLIRRRLLVEAEAMLDEIIDERGVHAARAERRAEEYASLFGGAPGTPK